MRMRSEELGAVMEALAPGKYRGWRRAELIALGQSLQQGDLDALNQSKLLDEATRDAIEQRALAELDVHEALGARAKAGLGAARSAYIKNRRDLDALALLLCVIRRSTTFLDELAALDADPELVGLHTTRTNHTNM